MKITNIVLVLCLVTIFSVSVAEYRSIDGTGNNLKNPMLGSAGSYFTRGRMPAEYVDFVSEPVERENPRTLSNVFGGATAYDFSKVPPLALIPKNTRGLNMFEAVFGQFANHDVDKNILANGDAGFEVELFPGDIGYIEGDDDNFARVINSTLEISEESGQAEAVNHVTAYFDLSQVYGSDEDVTNALRSFVDGKLITETFTFPLGPFFSLEFENLPPSPQTTGLPGNPQIVDLTRDHTAGDDRITENIGLTSVHTLYFREHNRLCDELKSAHPTWDDETLFQEARRINIAVYQHNLMDEYLPAILDIDIPEYDGYDKHANPDTPVHFAFQGQRYGHSTINDWKLRTPDTCPHCFTLPAGVIGPFPFTSDSLPFAAQLGAGFDPITAYVTAATTSSVFPGAPPVPNLDGLDNIMVGLLNTLGDDVDGVISDVLRNIPFTAAGNILDIYTNDIKRGRVHGAPNYNELRTVYHHDGPSRKGNLYRNPECRYPDEVDSLECFLNINSDENIALNLQTYYGKVNNIDGIVGLLAEEREEGEFLSRTNQHIILEKYVNGRGGDRFWYENTEVSGFSDSQIAEIKARTVAHIIRDNGFAGPIQDDAFHVSDNVCQTPCI